MDCSDMSSLGKRTKSTTSSSSAKRQKTSHGSAYFAGKRGRYRNYVAAPFEWIDLFDEIDESLMADDRPKHGAIKRVAEHHGVKRQTLSDRYSTWRKAGKPRPSSDSLPVPGTGDNRGPSTIFTREELQNFADYIRNVFIKAGLPLIYDDIKFLAKQLYNEKYSSNLRSSPRPPFSASNHWVQDFLSQHGFSVRTPGKSHISPPRETLAAEIAEYKRQAQAALEKFSPRNVLNMDETQLNAIIPVRQTIADRGTESVSILKQGNEKLGVTAVLTVSADGDKLTPLIVKKGKTRRTLVSLELGKCASKVIGDRSIKGWMNSRIMRDYLFEVVIPHLDGQPGALIMDCYRAHFHESVQEIADAFDIQLIQVPPGTTSKLQPLDIRVNGIIKNAAIVPQRRERHDDPNRQFKLSDAIRYFGNSWKRLARKDVKASWKPLLETE